MIVVEASEIIEILLDSGITKYSLKEQTLMRGRPIKSIVAYSGGLTSQGVTVADPSDAYAYFRESLSNDVRIKLPLKSVLYVPQFPVLQFIELPNRPFDWQQSYVEFGAAPTTGEVLQLLVVYEWSHMEK